MTKSDLLKILAPMDNDRVIVFVSSDGGWSNIETIIEKPTQIEMKIEDSPVFSDN